VQLLRRLTSAHAVAWRRLYRLQPQQPTSPPYGARNARYGVCTCRSLIQNRHSSAADPPTEEVDLRSPERRTNEDLLNQIIASLALPARDIVVVKSHSNQRYSSPEQAFAKLAGQNWTYYLNETEIVIGRGEKEVSVDVDLGPGKLVSRKHARIAYEDEEWWLTVDGRNGVKVDGLLVDMNERVMLSNGYV
jgi:FHA domain